MNTRLSRVGVILLAVCMAAGLASLLAGRSPDAVAQSFGVAGEHPEIDEDDALLECQVCHADVTPEIVDEWFAGSHGKFNVKCFVCHGTVGANFTRKPAAERCVGCHADRVASMQAMTAGPQDCFACHTNHLLDPHATASHGGDGR